MVSFLVFDSKVKVFWLFAIYFSMQTLLRIHLSSSLTFDEAEQVFMSQFWLLSYHGQPPLYNWLQFGLFNLLGKHVFALALLNNLILFAVYWVSFLSLIQAIEMSVQE